MTITYKLREGIPPLPDRMKSLAISEKGYPIPFFVAYVDGKPDFRLIDPSKMKRAIDHNLCWVCGGKLGRYKSFVGGSLMLINRTSAEPPLHHDCALFSVKACPFLLLPKAQRRESGLPDGAEKMAGMLPHNPTVNLIYTTGKYRLTKRRDGSPMFIMDDPDFVEWYTGGKLATREQATEGMTISVKAVMDAYQIPNEGRDTSAELMRFNKAIESAREYLPTL